MKNRLVFLDAGENRLERRNSEINARMWTEIFFRPFIDTCFRLRLRRFTSPSIFTFRFGAGKSRMCPTAHLIWAVVDSIVWNCVKIAKKPNKIQRCRSHFFEFNTLLCQCQLNQAKSRGSKWNKKTLREIGAPHLPQHWHTPSDVCRSPDRSEQRK